MRNFPSTLIIAIITCTAIMTVRAEQPEQSSRHIITGVPFVGWTEARGWKYPDREVLNPSFPAAYAMVLRYWGTDPAILERDDWGKQLQEQGWHFEEKQASSLTELRDLIDRNLPVLVLPAMTPFAHRIQPMNAIFWNGKVRLKDGQSVTLKLKSSRCGMLGFVAALDSLEDTERKIGLQQESLYVTARVIIGYDKERKTVLMHDPSLGPAWEVPEQDFEKMWQYSKREYDVLYPPNYFDLLGAKTSALPYARTPDNDAAVHYWYGCALESVDLLERAEEELRSGLQLPYISKGAEHLLRFELAQVLNLRGSHEEAIAEARKAVALIPDNPEPWRLIESVARCCGGKSGKKDAAEAADRVRSLCTKDGEMRFSRALAVEFDFNAGVVYCAGGH